MCLEFSAYIQIQIMQMSPRDFNNKFGIVLTPNSKKVGT